MAEDLKASVHGAAPGVGATVNEAGNSRLNHGSGAHRAGLDGDVNSGAIQAVISDAFRSVAESHDFGMRAGIASRNRAVSGARQETIAKHDDAPDGDLTSFRSGASLHERELHVGDVVHRGGQNHSARGTAGTRYSTTVTSRKRSP